MFAPRRLAYTIKITLTFGVQLCLVLSVCTLLLVVFDEKPFRDSTGQDRVDRVSRIELVKRELLNDDKRRQYEDQDFVSRTSEIAHRVFEIAPQVRATLNQNDSKAYQIDSNTGTIPKSKSRFLFVLHHYEQLGKTTENLLQLCAIAKRMNRQVVEPFVRDSRMCGVPGGWSGEQRKRSRVFRPFGLYFDVEGFNKLLSASGYATLTKLNTFQNTCRKETTTLVHFIYADSSDSKESLIKWYQLSAEQYTKVIKDVQHFGYCTCDFINKGLNISTRIGNLQIGRQVCVDPEKITSIDVFENQILLRDRCSVIVHWRGIGKNRTHFDPKVTIKPWNLVSSIPHSGLIAKEVSRYKEVSFLENNPYIGVHVRSERQLQWYGDYGVDRLRRCLSVMVQVVEKLKKINNIDKVFMSTDLSVYGSDTLVPLTSQDSGLKDRLNNIEKDVVEALNPLSFTPHAKKNSVLYDKGVVAITEMNLLFGSNHLVTIGSGTFQQWIIDVFIKQHSKHEHQDWTVTRICNREEKKVKF